MIVGVDFDGTCVTSRFPHTGSSIGAGPVLRLLQSKGVKLMLWTLRGNYPRDFSGNEYGHAMIKPALDWAEANGVIWDGVNECPIEGNELWTDSKKQFADIYIDDYALGCPLVVNKVHGKYVDWCIVLDMFYTRYEELGIKESEWLECIEEILKERNKYGT